MMDNDAPRSGKTGGDGPPVRKRRSGAEVRRKILDAAAAEFHEAGYQHARTARIARAAQATEAQIFRYFGSKMGLYQETIYNLLNIKLLAYASENFAAENVDDQDRRFYARDYIRNARSFLTANAPMLRHLFCLPGGPSVVKIAKGDADGLSLFFDRCSAIMAELGDSSPRVSHQLMARLGFSAILATALFHDWIFPESVANEDEIMEGLIHFVMSGMRTNGYPALFYSEGQTPE